MSIKSAYATSLFDINEILKIEDENQKIIALSEIKPESISDPIAANQYYVEYSKLLSNQGNIKAATQLLEEQLNAPRHKYSARYIARFYKTLSDIQYHNNEYDSARRNISFAIEHYKKAKNIEYLTHAITRQGSIELRTSNYVKGLNLVKAFEREYASQLTEKNLSSIYYFYGRAYDHINDVQTALEYKIKALEIEQKIGVSDKKQANTLYGIADSLQKIGRNQESYQRFKQTLEIDKKYGNKQDIGHSLTKLAYVAFKLEQYDLSIAHAKEAIDTFKLINHKRNQAWAKHNMSLSFAAKGNLKHALQLEKENKTFLAKTSGDYHIKTSVWNHLAELQFKLGKPKQAIEFAKEALNFGDSNTLKDRRLISLKLIHQGYEQLSDYKNAYEYQKQMVALQTDFHDNNFAQRLAFLQNTIEVKEKEQMLAKKEQENLKISSALAQHQTQQMVFILLFIVFVTFIFLIYLNIRQKRRLSEQETKHLNTLLEQRNKLFSQIAHDLSNPVTVASLHIEAMQHQIVECKPENLNKVSEKLTDLKQLVTDLAGLAKLETANFTLNTQQIDLKKFIDDIQDEIVTQPSKQKITMALQDLKVNTAYLDPIRIKQVIANLYCNSQKYTHANGEIDLQFAADESAFKITIQDSPPTVPNEYLNNIFNHLYRVPNMSNTEIPGHGIGLSIVRQIVTLHRGVIKATQSELGGLKIEVELPLK